MIEMKSYQLTTLNSLITAVGLLLVSFASGCGSCEDCGDYTNHAFGIINTLNEAVEFTFYLGSDSTSFTVDAFESIETTLTSRFGVEGVLRIPPLSVQDDSLVSPYDSARVVMAISNSRTLYLKEICAPGSPICKDNYAVSAEVDRSRNGNLTTQIYIFTVE